MRIIFFISTLLFFTAPCLSQDLTKEKEVNNLFSIAAGGTPTTIGITYERILNNRKISLEIGAGLLGGGLGMNFYPFKSFGKEQFNHFAGVRSSYNIQGSGGSRVVNYLPIGINYLSSKRLYFSVDVGPSCIAQLVHNGYPDPNQPLPDYPEYLFGVFGGFKLGFGF